MPGLAPYLRNLAADGRTIINARGTTIFVRTTSEELKVTARSDQVGGADGVAYTIRMSASEKWFTAEEFDSVEIENQSSVNATDIEVLIGSGDFFRPVPDIVNVAIDVPAARVSTPIDDKVNIDVGQAGKEQLAAVNLNRIALIITALLTNAEEIRIGDTNVDLNSGTPLAAGESLSWQSTAACFACSIATVDQAAALLEHTTE